MVKNKVDDDFQRQIAQILFFRNSKLAQSMQASNWLFHIAFHLRQVWLQALVAIDSNSRQRSFPSFCTQPSEMALLFNWNLSRHPVLVNLDLLLCSTHASEPQWRIRNFCYSL